MQLKERILGKRIKIRKENTQQTTCYFPIIYTMGAAIEW